MRMQRYDLEDGLIEIIGGFYLLLIGFIILGPIAFGTTASMPMSLLVLMTPTLLFGPFLKFLKTRFTYPRTGFVAPRPLPNNTRAVILIGCNPYWRCCTCGSDCRSSIVSSHIRCDKWAFLVQYMGNYFYGSSDFAGMCLYRVSLSVAAILGIGRSYACRCSGRCNATKTVRLVRWPYTFDLSSIAGG
ncbi:MAG: hypothetical protein GFH27_549297n26 [Chloroflexi bacterium AL-W]|nr:hypothetical protein [Chloroflexi bacterium AL-N1]NOK68552.1 hypothetical protein [Chloroflexi bacterium AL-N10]NOK76038.1 hypothetical protein [Chloroflexi bacterium AL-N5]NOK82509.1 hypothetical protein [Chloroflexi bacterium AL-W]NOK92821.1 hypothetical protein [Chloroflexi bacterium AL-N15]